MRHLPNVLTISRIVLTPLMLVLLMSNTFVGQAWAFIIFVYAAVSDYLDGRIARTYKVGSRLGHFLDPVADKVLVLGTFTALAVLIPPIIPWWGVALIALRDLVVTFLRTRIEAKGRSLRTLPIAKAKTVVQLVFLIAVQLVMVCAKAPGVVGRLGRWVLATPVPLVLFLGVVAFTVLTGVIYLVRHEETTAYTTDSHPQIGKR